MEKEEFIIIDEFCKYYSVEVSFIKELNSNGIVELTVQNEEFYINHEQIPALEKYINLYYNMDINMEGVEAIHHLLGRIEQLQREVRQLRNSI